MTAESLMIDALSDEAAQADGVNVFTVDLSGYEGPLHLLLELARRQKVDLLKLSMLSLAEQYLSFIESARTRRLDLAADYLLMAAWLAFMKSRLLLPKPEAVEDEPTGEEMAERLAFRLKRLEAMRQAVRDLAAGPILNNVVFLRGMPEQPKVIRRNAFHASLYDVVSAFAPIRSRREQERPHRIAQQPVLPIELARRTLQGLRPQLDHWARLDELRCAMADLDPAVPGRSVTASVFSAALELTRDGEVDMRQDAHYGPIYLRNAAIDGGEGDYETA
jgi:segregation and condensation protein A